MWKKGQQGYIDIEYRKLRKSDQLDLTENNVNEIVKGATEWPWPQRQALNK